MQVKTEHGTLKIGNNRPAISVAFSPQSRTSHLVTGIVIGTAIGFIAGSVATLLVGEKSLVFAQHVWKRLTGVNENGEQVHFELLLQ